MGYGGTILIPRSPHGVCVKLIIGKKMDSVQFGTHIAFTHYEKAFEKSQKTFYLIHYEKKYNIQLIIA
jgi:hypothetical protein